MSFSVASYNVLARAYVHRAWYPRSPAMVLNPSWRRAALAHYVLTLDADILCLQEVETQTLAALRARLAPLNYASQYARRQGGKPDGCATFYRRDLFELVDANTVVYNDAVDAQGNSGNIALVARLRGADRVIGVVNTHLTWDPPDAARELRRGHKQARQLLFGWESMAESANAWIFTGDFNVTPQSEIVAMIEKAGFHYAHQSHASACTCNVNGEAKMIDYLFYSPTLRSDPEKITPIDASTVLPSAEQPSDHVAIAARFDWNV
ncbi:MAG: endonuclease/exonuclease/phosphatase family protein [Candidatus Binatia bacterium]